MTFITETSPLVEAIHSGHSHLLWLDDCFTLHSSSLLQVVTTIPYTPITLKQCFFLAKKIGWYSQLRLVLPVSWNDQVGFGIFRSKRCTELVSPVWLLQKSRSNIALRWKYASKFIQCILFSSMKEVLLFTQLRSMPNICNVNISKDERRQKTKTQCSWARCLRNEGKLKILLFSQLKSKWLKKTW